MHSITKTLFGAFLALFLGLASAALTPAQVGSLKAACIADIAVCKPLHDAADDTGLANYFNADTVTYIVWRTSVSRTDVMRDAAFDWTRVDNLTVGKSRIWDMMFQDGPINPGNANVRAGIDAAWVGTAADLAVRAAVYAVCKRSANRAERVLASGAGISGSPSLLTFTGAISVGEASTIRS